MEKKSPKYGSTILPESGYYIMRNGWQEESNYLIISAGLSKQKPDHQHGDMIGLYSYANENIVLPNYQTRYFLSDYAFFKNSFVKNVAMVDSIPQGQNWKGNSGGSGFGKWKSLPEPNVIYWEDNGENSLFIGSHNGYDKIGVTYSRMVLFIKDGFYIVKDEFKNSAKTEHEYQQVWQGHYSYSNNNKLLRSTFPNGSGLEIFQLSNNNYSINTGNARGKSNSIISFKSYNDNRFLTVLHPFDHFERRMVDDNEDEMLNILNWTTYYTDYSNDNVQIEANNIFAKGDAYYLFGFKKFNSFSNIVECNDNSETDFKMSSNNEYIEFQSLNASIVELMLSRIVDDNSPNEIKVVKLKTGEIIRIEK